MRPPIHLLLVLPFAQPLFAQALGPAPEPPENPVTEEKRVLGKVLFWDEQLSSDNTVACGTCHIPAAGGSDPRLDMDNRHPGLDEIYGNEDDRFASAGVRRANAMGLFEADGLFGFERQVTGRRAPSMIGAGHFDELFWDGRAGTTFVDPLSGATMISTGGALETQSLGPILSFVEMADEGRTWADVTSKLERVEPLALAGNLNPDLVAALAVDPTYPDLFEAAFGDPAITPVRIAYALASYQRTLNPDQTPYDLWQQGVPGAMTSQQIQGFNTFMNPGLRCSTCHPPPFFSDLSYRNIGMRDIAEDNGRQSVTGLFSDRGKFKVPSLRNVGLRDRFFHHGDPTWETLFLSIFIYNQGAGMFNDNKDPILNTVFFAPSTANAIENFLGSALTDPRVEDELPPFDRPKLFSESGSAATIFGAPRAGSGGFDPKIVATSPGILGNAEFRIGLNEALGSTRAILLFAGRAPTTGMGFSLQPRFVVAQMTSGVGSGGGYATWNGAIPEDPALAGWRFDFRWYVADPGALGGWSASRTARVTLFQ